MTGSARDLLERHGATGAALDTALGIAYAESAGYADAVGDYTLVDPKWGPSVGLFQIRTLRDPNAWGVADRVRDINRLRDPDYQAHAFAVLSQNWTVWTPWSVYTSGSYQAHVGKDFPIRWGHRQAQRWNLDGLAWSDVAAIKATVTSLETQVATLAANYAKLAPAFRSLADGL